MADYIWPPPPSKYGQMKKNDTPVNDDPKKSEDSSEDGEGEKKVHMKNLLYKNSKTQKQTSQIFCVWNSRYGLRTLLFFAQLGLIPAQRSAALRVCKYEESKKYHVKSKIVIPPLLRNL